MTPGLALRFMAREARGAAGKIVFFVTCLAVGVTAVTTVSGLSRGIDRGVRGEARRLLAADLSVRAEKALPDEVERALSGLAATTPGFARVSVRELATVVSVPGSGAAPGPSALVLLKAVGDGYPFYGDLTTEPAHPLSSLLDPEGALVAPELRDKLHLAVGSRLRIGSAEFTVRGVIDKEPDKINVAFSLGPRVMVSLSAFERTGLEAFGSRIDRIVLVRLPNATQAELEKTVAGLRRTIPEAAGVRVQSYADAQPALRDGLRRLARFLGLVALVSLILGGIGVAQTVRAWIATRLDAIAVLKCLGMRPAEIDALYALETVILGLAGSALGVLVATIVLGAAPRLLAGVLPSVPISAFQPGAAARGLLLGTGIAVLFSIAPLSSIRRVPPLRVLRRDAEPLSAGVLARLVLGAALLAGIGAAAYAQSGSVRIAAAFLGGIVAATLALAGAARALISTVARVSEGRVRIAVRHGLSALTRPNAGTLSGVIALGLGVLMIVAIALVHLGLMSRLRADLPKDAPNVFLVDMQTGQWPDAKAVLERAGATEIRSVPIVNARLTSIDGIGTAELAKKGKDEGRRRWILTREQNLTYLDTLPKDNVVVEGSLWSDPAHPEISIERDFAKDMGAHIGSKLVFDIQGVPIELTVTSLRTVDWKSFGINFFLVVEPGVLDHAPQMRVAAAQIPAGREQALQDELAAKLPNVTMLRVREIVEKVGRVLERVGLAVRILGGFAILAGIAILGGAVAATASRRGSEVALLKTLGATRRRVVAMFTVEFAMIGLVAGLIGTAAGAVLAWGVLTRAMELGWTWRPWVLVAAPLATVGLSILAGITASAGALRRRPIDVLRAE